MYIHIYIGTLCIYIYTCIPVYIHTNIPYTYTQYVYIYIHKVPIGTLCARQYIIYIHTNIPYIYTQYVYILIEGTPPLRVGFLFTMFADHELGGRGPPSKQLVQIRRGGSSFSVFLTREHGK